jgi:thiol-disulfide isomerase/thioredoxin
MTNRLILSILISTSIFIHSSCQHAGGTDKNTPRNSPQVGLNIGNLAPEISAPDKDGKNINLSSLRGKIVLLDFWASWCPPCRAESPNLVQAFNHFNDKNFKNGNGFTIYSVSLDRTKEAWLNGIKEDQLNWPSHVSDLKYWNSEPAKKYNIQGIPMNFLLDGSGLIIAKGLRQEALYETLDSLIKK